MNIDIRRKTRVGRSSHCQIEIGGKRSLNSNKPHNKINSKITISTAETEVNFAKDSEKRLKSRDIYSLKGFAEKMLTPEPGGSTT